MGSDRISNPMISFLRSAFHSVLLFFFFYGTQAISSNDTTLQKIAEDSVKKSEKPLTCFITSNQYSQGSYQLVDTTLDEYHYYFPGFYHNYKSLGNIGSPQQSLFYRNPSFTGFDLGLHFLDAYASDKEKIKYYNTRRPYSKLFFVMGSKEEQILSVKHTQNVGKSFNFGLDYTNLSSTGFYLRQKTRGNNLHLHTHYEHPTKWYGSFANFVFHNTAVEENGGLWADIYFDEAIEDRKDALPVSLQNAKNTFRKKSWFLGQYLNLGKREEVFDPKDSVTRKVVSPVFRVSHTFSFEKKYFSYRDAFIDSGQYLSLFILNRTAGPQDTIKDSLNIKIFENTISFNTVDFTDIAGRHHGFKNIFVSLFARQQYIARLTHNDNFDTTFTNVMAGAEINFIFFNSFKAGGSATQVLNGFNLNDHYYYGFFEFFKPELLGSDHRFRINTFHQVKHPDWIYSHYFSDQLQWKNDFENISYSGQSISYSSEKWKIKIEASQNYYKNPVYFSYENIYSADTVFIAKRIIPSQRKGRFNINQLTISKHIKLWKFHLRSNIYFQEPSNEFILAFPDFITYHSFYFESPMLRKAILGQIGVDLFYHSSYSANAYSPFLKQFYVQSDKKVGNYPFFDFFFNFKIKSVRAFFKITHINSGYSGNTYYMVPHYPQADRAFHLGIDWRFLD